MSLCAPRPDRQATFAVVVFAPASERDLASYEEHLLIDRISVRCDELDSYVSGFQQRAGRWFDLQRKARQIVAGRGTVNEHLIRLDWLTETLAWPRVSVSEQVTNVDIPAAEAFVASVAERMSLAPAWSLGDLAADREGPVLATLTERRCLRLQFYGGPVNVTLDEVPAHESTTRIRERLDGRREDVAQLAEWAARAADRVVVELREDWQTRNLTVTAIAQRGSWRSLQSATSEWSGSQLDVRALLVPGFDGPLSEEVPSRDVMARLAETYDFDGPVAGATMFSGFPGPAGI